MTSDSTQDSTGRAVPGLLTDHEREAGAQAGLLYNYIKTHIVGHEQTREADIAELESRIHGIQRMVQAQAGARAYPGQYRLLGEVTAAGQPSGPGTAHDLLTGHEREAVRQAGRLYDYIAENIVAHGRTRDEDLAEIRSAVHAIQQTILSQAAARAYPGKYRLLGGTVKVLDELPPPSLPSSGGDPGTGRRARDL